MSETVITVKGRFSAFYLPERANVHVTVATDASERSVAFASAVESADAVEARIAALLDKTAGPVTSFSSDSVQVWSERPWNQDGLVLAPIYRSRVGFVVKFSDFAQLAAFIEAISDIEGVTVQGLDWHLTETTRSAAIAEVRSRAVKDAVVKATIYAQSIGLGTVRAIAIADEGMLDGVAAGASGSSPMRELRMMGAADQASPALSLTPAELEIAAVVDGRFIAS